MSHGVWVQRTPQTAYNVQGYNNVPWGMDEQTVSPGRWLRAYICRVEYFTLPHTFRADPSGSAWNGRNLVGIPCQ